MKEHTPTAWDLDVRSFMSDMLRDYSRAHPVNTPPGEHLVKQAVLMADEVQKVRNERGWKSGVAFLEGEALRWEAERKATPTPLPKILAIGTMTLSGEWTVVDAVHLTADERCYEGTWAFKTDLTKSAALDVRTIDWESWHRARLAEKA